MTLLQTWGGRRVVGSKKNLIEGNDSYPVNPKKRRKIPGFFETTLIYPASSGETRRPSYYVTGL